MRQYMPGPHRRFLEHLTTIANIRDFVEARKNNKGLTIAYDACLHMLRTFRDKHIQIVSRYIIVPAKEARKQSSSASPDQESAKTSADEEHERSRTSVSPFPTKFPRLSRQGLAKTAKSRVALRGTGGTALIPFLKQARDETG